MNSFCLVIWYRKDTKEWRYATDKFGSRHLCLINQFREYRILKVQDEYFRKIYQLVLR